MPHDTPADRRLFLQQLGTDLALGSLALAGAPALAAAAAAPVSAAAADSAFDMSWTKRLRGKHKLVFDVPDIADGYGVLRGAMVARQYVETFKVASTAVNAVIVLRHDGIVLAMNQAYWDAYDIGKTNKVKNPMTEEPTTKNPALLSEADGVPASAAQGSLTAQIANGAIVLACNFAFGDIVATIRKSDKVDAAAARTKALGMLIPGVVLQPSGVFATSVAQEHGCVYVRAT